MGKRYPGNNHNPKGANQPSEHTRALQLKILEMRREWPPRGYVQIARDLDLSLGYVYKLYKQALKAIIHESVDVIRKTELHRLEELQTKVMQVVTAFTPLVSAGQVVHDSVTDEFGNPVIGSDEKPMRVKLQDLTPVLQGIQSALRIMERRAKLLGLDAPTKTAMTNPDGTKESAFVQFYLPQNGRENQEETPDGN